MHESQDDTGAAGKPRSIEAFRERLLNQRHQYTNR